MGNVNGGELDRTWVWVGLLGIIGLIIGLVMIFAMENRTPGAIVTVISAVVLLIAAILWWQSSNKPPQRNGF